MRLIDRARYAIIRAISPPVWDDYWYQPKTSPVASGVEVNSDTAISGTAVLCAVRLVSQTLGMLPLSLYAEGDSKSRATNHPLHDLLRWQPNPWQTAIEAKETVQAHAMLWGNGYARIHRNGRGEVSAYTPLHPSTVSPEFKDGKLQYQVSGLSDTRTLVDREVFNLRGFSTTGILGLNPITTCRESIGVGIAMERHIARFFGNGSRPGGILRFPGKLSDADAKLLKASWEEAHSGTQNAHRVAVIQGGGEYTQTGIGPQEAQLLEGRTFQVLEVARMFGVTPHMLMELSRATFSNIEKQGLEFLTYCLGPWLERWEQRIRKDLLRPDERGRYYSKFNTAALLRTTTLERFTAYQKAITAGWLTRNEVREREELERLEGLDEPLYPLNMGDSAAPRDDATQAAQ